MNIWQKHIAYLKDNPEGYWFKRKLYGYGWTPAKPQGWLVIGFFVLALVLNALRFDFSGGDNGGAVINFLIQSLVLILVLILVCYKTGEKPKWQWGIEDDSDKSI